MAAVRYSTRLAGAAGAGWKRALRVSCVLVALWHATAAAQPLELDWDAPAECPSKAQAEAQIAELLQAAGSQRAAPAVAAHIAIEQVGGRYRLRLRIASGTRNAARELHAPRCEELVEVAAWLVALAIDPALPSAVPDAEAGARELEGRTPRSASTSGDTDAAARPDQGARRADEGGDRTAATVSATAGAERARPSDAASQRGAAPATPVRLSFHAGVAGGVFAGAGVGAQAALSAFAALGADWSYTQARVTAHLPRSIEIGPGARAELWSWALELSECALWGRTLRGGPCVVLTGLRTNVEARGVSSGDPHPALWATAGAGMQLLWRIRGALELSLGSRVSVPVSPRPSFTVAPLGPVIRAEAWSVDAQLGLAFATP
jgi:hypothetical protein